MRVVGVGKQQIYALQAISLMHVSGHNLVLVPPKLSFFANQQAGGGKKSSVLIKLNVLFNVKKYAYFGD